MTAAASKRGFPAAAVNVSFRPSGRITFSSRTLANSGDSLSWLVTIGLANLSPIFQRSQSPLGSMTKTGPGGIGLGAVL